MNNTKPFHQVVGLALGVLLLVGCGGTQVEPSATPIPPTVAPIPSAATPISPTVTPSPPPASPTATLDPELEAFATELIDITLRLREGILAVLTAPTEEEMKAAFSTLAEINSDAQNLSVPDNEVAQELMPYLLSCTEHFHEDMSIDQFLQVTQDCTLYIQLYDELFGTDDDSSSE